MKVIKLEEAHALLKKASAVFVNNDLLVRPIVDELQGKPKNVFLFLEWIDNKGEYITLSFTEGDNNEVAISGKNMFLYDSESESEYDNIKINILTIEQLENK
jgi:hypothetical protein